MAAQPQRPADLAGTFTFTVSDQHADFFVRNMAVLLVEQDLSPYGRYAWWKAVSRQWLDDTAFVVELAAAQAYEYLRPWTRPDKSWPTMTLFGPLERAERLWRRLKARARRTR